MSEANEVPISNHMWEYILYIMYHEYIFMIISGLGII